MLFIVAAMPMEALHGEGMHHNPTLRSPKTNNQCETATTGDVNLLSMGKTCITNPPQLSKPASSRKVTVLATKTTLSLD